MKRIISFFMVFMLLFTSTAFASEVTAADDQSEQDVITETVVVNPRYTYLDYMKVGMEIDNNGKITYGGSARAINRNVRITLYLQRSTNGLFWDDLEATVKTAYDNVAADGWRNVTPGNYYYRVKIVTDVMDSNRNIIETATGYSSEEQY